MAKKAAPKKVEYKDTFEFKLFPEYEYTKIQKKRFRLFQGTVKRWHKDINYADSFDNPNEINLLFMLGYDKNMKAYVDRTKNNTVVLCADIPKEYLEIYDEYWKLVAKYKGTGDVTSEGKFTKWYYQTRDLNWRHRNDPDVLDWSNKATASMVQRFDEEDKIITGYDQLQKDIWKYYDRYIILDKTIPERTTSFDKLDAIIKRYFPKGREACGCTDKCFGGAKTLEAATLAGLNHDNASKYLGLKEDSYSACSAIIKHCKKIISDGIKTTGNVNFDDVFNEMKKPPYGWSCDCHAAYCFGYAASGFTKKAWVYDSVIFLKAEDYIQYYILGALNKGDSIKERSRQRILVSEAGTALSPRLAYLLGVEDEVSENVPLGSIAMWCRKKAETLTKFPLAILDDKLYDLLNGDFMEYDKTHSFPIDIIGYKRVNELLDYFTWEKCRELKPKIQNADEIISKIITDKYNLPVEIDGVVIDLDLIRANCTCQCAPWCHSAKFFWENADDLFDQSSSWWRERYYRQSIGELKCPSPQYEKDIKEWQAERAKVDTIRNPVSLPFDEWRKKKYGEQQNI